MSTEARQYELELAVLRTLALMGPQHGLGLARRILQLSDGVLGSNQSTLYPALLRLEQRRWIRSQWGVSDNNRKAKFYHLTTGGRRQIRVCDPAACGPDRIPGLPQSAMVMLAATLLSPLSKDHSHVRTSEPRIRALIEAGIHRSETFGHLVDALDASDVIVYIKAKQMRETLGGYLAHNVTVGGAFRYLHMRIRIQGAENHLIALLAHELQHAVEVAQAPDSRDADSLEKMFSRLAIPYGCPSRCYETKASIEIEDAVRDELKAARRSRRLTVTASEAPDE